MTKDSQRAPRETLSDEDLGPFRMLAFADLCPSEGEPILPDSTISIVITVAGPDTEAFIPSVQYKKARKRKHKMATILTSAISTGKALDTFAVAGWATGKDLYESGETVLTWLNFDRTSDKVRFEQHQLPIARARSYAWYAWALSVLSVDICRYAAFQHADRLELMLDTIAGDAPPGAPNEQQPGFEFVKHVTKRLLMPFWREWGRRSFLDIGIGYPTTTNGTKPKNLRGAVMSDWIVAAYHARITDPDENLDKLLSALEMRKQVIIHQEALRCNHLDIYLTPERTQELARPIPPPPPIQIGFVTGPGSPKSSAVDIFKQLDEHEITALASCTQLRHPSGRQLAAIFDADKHMQKHLQSLGIMEDDGRTLTAMGKVVTILARQSKRVVE